MPEHELSRKLVKSGPELWAECSDPGSLARHLGSFGEIRITKLEPETAVAWEGAAARGTVRLEPAGWGTRVTLTVSDERVTVADERALQAGGEPEDRPAPVTEGDADTAAAVKRDATPSPWALSRVWARLRGRPAPEPEPDGPVPPAARQPDPSQPPAARQPDPSQPPPAPPTVEPVLTAALDSLGRAHRQPYSRA